MDKPLPEQLHILSELYLKGILTLNEYNDSKRITINKYNQLEIQREYSNLMNQNNNMYYDMDSDGEYPEIKLARCLVKMNKPDEDSIKEWPFWCFKNTLTLGDPIINNELRRRWGTGSNQEPPLPRSIIDGDINNRYIKCGEEEAKYIAFFTGISSFDYNTVEGKAYFKDLYFNAEQMVWNTEIWTRLKENTDKNLITMPGIRIATAVPNRWKDFNHYIQYRGGQY